MPSRTGGIPVSPWGPVPRSSCSKTVSAWSSRWWAVAIKSAAAGIRRAAEEVIAGAAARLLHRQAPDGAQGVDVHRFGVEAECSVRRRGRGPGPRHAGRWGAYRGSGGRQPRGNRGPDPASTGSPAGRRSRGRRTRRRGSPAGGREHPPARHPRGQVQGLTHPRHSGSPACRSAVYSGIQRSSTLPVSPWRFLATMHSATLRFSASLL